MDSRDAAPARDGITTLPAPRTEAGARLMQAMARRCSCRGFGPEPLPPQELSDVLWAAAGLNRDFAGTGIRSPGARTAPAAHNWQETDVFVALEAGLFRYEPEALRLVLELEDDVRALTAHPSQPFVLDAPAVLIYVADLSRMDDATDWDLDVMPWVDAGVMAENVYLVCASLGLGTVVRALFDHATLARAMRLGPDRIVTFSQPLGYPS